MENSENMEITCKECGTVFTITPDEQKWYEKMNFDLPKRCKECRKAKKNASHTH